MVRCVEGNNFEGILNKSKRSCSSGSILIMCDTYYKLAKTECGRKLSYLSYKRQPRKFISELGAGGCWQLGRQRLDDTRDFVKFKGKKSVFIELFWPCFRWMKIVMTTLAAPVGRSVVICPGFYGGGREKERKREKGKCVMT